MPRDSVESNLVRLCDVRAISDGLVLICEMADGYRIGISSYFIAASSEVRKPGDVEYARHQRRAGAQSRACCRPAVLDIAITVPGIELRHFPPFRALDVFVRSRDPGSSGV